MSNKLYPLSFRPKYLSKIWGGQRLRTVLNKNFGKLPNCGESWEISGIDEYVSVVNNGFLKGNNINELIEVFMDEMLGESIYKKYGNEFPLLLKYIDASDNLSVQVHPDDRIARSRHGAYGKTEMWYVIDNEPGAKLYVGFNKDVSKEEYISHLNNNTIEELLNAVVVKPGDVFFIPAGRVHAIGKGVLLAEIQQTSDITYRIYDWGRTDASGKSRELHTDLALEAIDFSHTSECKTSYSSALNKPVKIADCEYFTVAALSITECIKRDFSLLDSFVAYLCISGKLEILCNNESIVVEKGESLLIPASIKEIDIKPHPECILLEAFAK